MQTRSDTLRKTWGSLAVFTLQIPLSAAIYFGLPTSLLEDFYVVSVVLAAAFLGVVGALASSSSSLLLLILFGYALKDRPLPSPLHLTSQAVLYLGVGLLVAIFDRHVVRAAQAARKDRDRNLELMLAFNAVSATNDQLREENSRLERLRETTMQFVGSVAHDLRSSTTVVGGNAQVLLRLGDRLNAEKRTDLLQGIVYASNQVRNATENLLDASLIEAGHFSLTRQELDVHKLLADCSRMFAGNANEHILEVRVRPDVPTVDADPENVMQVLVNLVTNAIKYSPPKSKVVVQAAHVRGFVAVSVADQGIGIAPQDLERIFERYYRTDGAVGSKAGGAGLGLSISRDIVLKHGGDLTVKSQVGVGSKFTFTLPVYSGESAHDRSDPDRLVDWKEGQVA
ncbi:MAG: HAMP domain-containing sensor histidine kinase [Dehalococcoidales bacterium]|nr:HAMP domain-containing sensor histidine kinase [Dehalococcoidales bacterium]